MHGVLAAERTIFVHFKLVRSVLLVFERVVVPLLALVASESDFYSHFRHLLVVLGLLCPVLPPCVGRSCAAKLFCAQKISLSADR